MGKTKIKTCKTAAKRFKISGTGKLICLNAANSHMFMSKSHNRRRRLDVEKECDTGNRKRVRRMLAI